MRRNDYEKDMEDAHTQLLSLDNDKNSAFFAVYDGHGGHKVAEYAGFHLHEKILNQPSFSEIYTLLLVLLIALFIE